MKIDVKFLDKLRLEARFDDFSIITDQPIRYKGDGTSPSPFDYFLASSALCAAYFIRVYCSARKISVDDIRLVQNNIIDPNDRYSQVFNIDVDLPPSISERDRQGILRSIDRCTVKKVIQTTPEFSINLLDSARTELQSSVATSSHLNTKTRIVGKDLPLEVTIQNMTSLLSKIGIEIEVASWRNPVPNVWSVHIRDADCPTCFTNGKGASKDSALCSALGEYLERLSCNYFYNDYYLGQSIAAEQFVHYPNEKWFPLASAVSTGVLPTGLLDDTLLEVLDPSCELKPEHLLDTNSGDPHRGICALPFVRDSDKTQVYIPVSVLGNLYVSNGMSAGNNLAEAKVQCLSEIFERAVKKEIIEGEISLPDVPQFVLERFPKILAGIQELESKGYPVMVKDASLGGKFPVVCVALMNPLTGGVFASFGAHPRLEVALERSLTELLQGRSFEGLKDVPPPTFSNQAVTEPNNFIEHFIDSTGVVSWKFFSDTHKHSFCDWNFEGTTEKESEFLVDILKSMGKEIYISEYTDLGCCACRIIVPGYSEIYPIEDLVWDNTNKALRFRKDVLCVHQLDEASLKNLIEKFEEADLDDYTRIAELIGIEFDENTPWGQIDIGELKCLIYLALGDLENAQVRVGSLINFNDHLSERKLFYRALEAVLEVELDSTLEYQNFKASMIRMFGGDLMDNVLGSVSGSVRFFGLSVTGMDLRGLDKHLNIIKSYEKIHAARMLASMNTRKS